MLTTAIIIIAGVVDLKIVTITLTPVDETIMVEAADDLVAITTTISSSQRNRSLFPDVVVLVMTNSNNTKIMRVIFRKKISWPHLPCLSIPAEVEVGVEEAEEVDAWLEIMEVYIQTKTISNDLESIILRISSKMGNIRSSSNI